MLPGRDEDLLSGDVIAVRTVRHGLRAQKPQIRSAMRFGQVHRAGPLAGDEIWQIGRLLLVCSVVYQRRVCAMGQTEIHHERHVGGGMHRANAEVQDRWHPLTAIVRVALHRRPTTLDHHVVGGLEARRGVDNPVLQPASLGIADGVQGGQDIACDLAGLRQDCSGVVRIQLCIAGDIAVCVDLQRFMQNELKVAYWRFVVRHGCLPSVRSVSDRYSAA